MKDDKIPKLKDLTDVEAEDFLNYLYSKKRAKTIIEIFLETSYGKYVFAKWWREKEKTKQ
jgi:hypothetical protein